MATKKPAKKVLAGAADAGAEAAPEKEAVKNVDKVKGPVAVLRGATFVRIYSEADQGEDYRDLAQQYLDKELAQEKAYAEEHGIDFIPKGWKLVDAADIKKYVVVFHVLNRENGRNELHEEPYTDANAALARSREVVEGSVKVL